MILLFVCLRVNDVICDAVWYVNCECDGKLQNTKHTLFFTKARLKKLSISIPLEKIQITNKLQPHILCHNLR